MDSVEWRVVSGGGGSTKEVLKYGGGGGIEMGERVKVAGKVPLGSYGVKEEETYFVVGRILVGRCPIALQKGRLFSTF